MDLTGHPHLKKLRMECLWFVLTYTITAMGGYIYLTFAWKGSYADQWIVPVALVFIYELGLLGANLSLNHPLQETALLPSLGIATFLTLARGALLGFLAGFIGLPWPEGWLRWIPGVLYLCAALADYFDGFAARMTDHTTVLGEKLDVDFDALGILIAPLFGVWHGQLPIWYLLVSLSRYLFIIGTWTLKRQGRQVHDLPAGSERRLMAGFQMGFIAVVLFPVFTPPGTFLVATIFMIPLLVGFARDWLVVSGTIDPESKQYQTLMRLNTSIFYNYVPFILRVGLGIIIVSNVIGSATRMNLFIWGQLMLAIPVVAGFTGRFNALLLLLLTGWVIADQPLDLISAMIVSSSTLIMLLGSGRWSLLRPEERFLHWRGGEQSSETT